jgi:hypothetical protein
MAISDVGELPPDVLEKAQLELQEEPEKIPDRIEELRQLIKEKVATGKAENIPLIRLEDDAFLLRFLRAKKYRMEDVCKLYLNYCNYRVKHKEIFEDLNVDKVRYLFENKILGILEHPSKSGCRVLVLFPGRTNVADPVIFDDMVRAELLILEKMMEDPSSQVHGMMALEDWTGVSSVDVVKLTVFAARDLPKLTELYDGGFPVRMKSMYHFQEPHLIDGLFAVVKPFLSQKMKERVKFLGSDYGQLHQLMSPDVLPEEFGGTMPPFSGDYSLRFLKGTTEEGK